ncbi:FG-GAP-like repeat-containing protein [Tunicatimonas pelagia]|uniref:FG-GAP-like repeat-containing protein n=1 Tax=Tunicatimonas pelagia TaxID=931531 RepID=UPI002664F264|nr:FG-GAP-like repeat-containing protein [Tunicatimonas pelagia]WKN41891.1 FG-GAP-like repeat-containing protein [Tunicatimonas pelagia]
MYYQIRQLALLFFLLNTTFSYAQFEKQTLLQADGTGNSEPYRAVAFIDADQDGDQDIVGEIISDPTFVPININFSGSAENTARHWSNTNQPAEANASIALINALGEAVGATLTLKTTWDGVGERGYNEEQPGFYPPAATRSYYFTSGTEEMTISGLNADDAYNFTFYGSSLFDDDRTAIYRIGSQEVELNASDNESNTVAINNVTPAEDGSITVEVAKKGGARYAFLNAMVIELSRQKPHQYKLLTNNGQTPFAAGGVVDEAANWSFGKAADLNQDTYPDIVAYDTEDQQLLWYENQDGAGFVKKTVGSGGLSYTNEDQVSVLDINQDDALDILVKEGNQLYWYQQTNGTFANRALWAEGEATNLAGAPVIRGDIDGDNLLDIIWSDDQKLYPLTSKNAYALGAPIQVAGLVSPIALAVTDMNGDDQTDLVITEGYNWTGSYRVGYLANSAGGLTNTPTFLTITDTDWLNLRPSRLQADDIDKDGDLDFYVSLAPEACSGVAPAQTGWLENQGDWQSAQYHALSTAEVQWTDIDQDGDHDLISNTGDATGIAWTENAKSAWDSTVYQSVNQPIIDKVARVVPERKSAALTGLTVQSTHHVADVAIQQGNILLPQIQAKLHSAEASFAQADIDADGIAELFVADVNAEGFTVVRWKNSASGSIQELVTHRGMPRSNGIFVAANGLLFAPVNEAGSQYGWWKLTDERFIRAGTIEGAVTQLVDIDADGASDVLTTDGWYRNVSNTQFTRNTTAKGNYAVDMDGDGDIDIVDALGTGTKTWYVNQGDGSFTSKPLGLGSEEVLVFADLDGDGSADVVQSSANGLTWRAHTEESGTFEASTAIDDFAARQVTAIDTDADGDVDLIAHNQEVVIQYKNTFQSQENTAPEAQQAIEDQIAEADTVYQFQVPDSAFKDNDTGDVLTYSAKLSDESTLPAWLTFTANTRTFSGTPALGDTGTLTIQVQVADSEGATATQDFDLSVVAEDTTTNPGDGGPVTGIGDESTTELILYPNPVERGEAIVIKNLPLHKFTGGRVYSAQGKELIKIQPGNSQIDSSSLTPGVYLLELRGREGIYRRRLIVK